MIAEGNLKRWMIVLVSLTTLMMGCDSLDPTVGAPVAGTITGKAVGADGGGLPGVTISLAGPQPQTTTTAADGSYRFVDVEAGAHTVTAAVEGIEFDPASQVVTISDGDRDASADFEERAPEAQPPLELAKAQVLLTASAGEGDCGYPTEYTDTVEIEASNGEVVIRQPSTGDENRGPIDADGNFTASQDDPQEAYEGTIDADYNGTATNTYTDANGCTTRYSIVFELHPDSR